MASAGLAVAACNLAPAPARAGGGARLEATLDREVFALCSSVGPERCFDATDDNCNGLIDEGCGIQTGLVQVVIAWDAEAADLDLRVTDPSGELVEPTRPTASGLSKERDCPGQDNACHGQNWENVFLAEDAELPRGKYRVTVRLESLGGEQPPVGVRLGIRLGPKTYSARFELTAPEQERSFDVVL